MGKYELNYVRYSKSAPDTAVVIEIIDLGSAGAEIFSISQGLLFMSEKKKSDSSHVIRGILEFSSKKDLKEAEKLLAKLSDILKRQ